MKQILLTDLSLFTRQEQMIGTPHHMSPEQAQAGGIDIDTRSDIYSPGVLLYELLAGRTPLSLAPIIALPSRLPPVTGLGITCA